MIPYYLEGIVLRARDTEINETCKISAFKKVSLAGYRIYSHVQICIYNVYKHKCLHIRMHTHLHNQIYKHTTKIPNNDKYPAEN